MSEHPKGVIYILTNPAFPEYVKIGYANDLEKRMAVLNNSAAIPYAFRAYAIYEVGQRLSDKELHHLIDTLNPELRSIENFDGRERKREFYAMSPEDAYSLLEHIAKISGTASRLKRVKPNGRELLEEQEAENTRKGPIKLLEDCQIPQGDFVEFMPDLTIRAKVVDDRHIEYKGEVVSLTALADKIYFEKGKGPFNQAATLVFSYKGVRLTDLRDKIERRRKNE